MIDHRSDTLFSIGVPVNTSQAVLINTSSSTAYALRITGTGLPSLMASYMSSQYRNCVSGRDATTGSSGLFVIPPSSVATFYAGPLHNSFFDFAIFAEDWGRDDCHIGNNWCEGADSTQDESVLLDDLADFAAEWLEHV